jgi:hypothetical protein
MSNLPKFVGSLWSTEAPNYFALEGRAKIIKLDAFFKINISSLEKYF